ncbi:SPOR domain-containing protein [Pseudomonas stutzeri]|uniref:Sporulation protein n=1 Tax=Stutzerimonas stutzeri KOS6 TaxID=1218352 RepID=A0A061JL98_STUST|nr:SPOR domain-containing protein [Stutzerimonas stutzeri]EWC38944.1 sporulation protein [Stutzerimonas stutzeri KOS6]MBK3868724.1 SPOR domain-containing protein [Stutzerimonas stutzeri]
MRWFFLLLVLLNAFFWVQHQYQAPVRVKEVAPLDVYGRANDGIKLLSESQPLERREEVVPGHQAEDTCLFLGGFDEERAAASLEQRLLSLDVQSDLQVVDTAGSVDYWVYLPPLASRQASLRQLRELQSRSIDSYIITVGDLANGISLGIFSRKDSAEGVVARLREVDYVALMRELPRMHRKYWVRVAAASRHQVGDALLSALKVDMPALQHQQMSCAVASSG